MNIDSYDGTLATDDSTGGTRRWRKGAALVAATALTATSLSTLAVTVLDIGPASAANETFATTYNKSIFGDFILVGNGQMRCPDVGELDVDDYDNDGNTTETLSSVIDWPYAAQCHADQDNNNTYRANGTGSPVSYPNDSRFEMWADVDGDPSTVNSSTATFTIPAGATVDFAQLYWHGNNGEATNNGFPLTANQITTLDGNDIFATPGWQGCNITSTYLDWVTAPSGAYGVANLPTWPGGVGTATSPNNPIIRARMRAAEEGVAGKDRTKVKVKINGGSYSTITSDDTDDIGAPNFSGQLYQEQDQGEILPLLQAAPTGTPLTVTVADVVTPEGFGCTGAWGLVLVWKFPSRTPPAGVDYRRVAVYDGFQEIASTNTATISLNSFLASDGALAEPRFGVVGYEGDPALVGDSLRFEGDVAANYLPEPRLTGVPNSGTPSASRAYWASTVGEFTNSTTADFTRNPNLTDTAGADIKTDNLTLAQLNSAGPTLDFTIATTADRYVNTMFSFSALVSYLSGTVYQDTNNNGIQDSGEPGIPGVTVTLTGTSSTGAAQNYTVTTGPDGSYVFAGPNDATGNPTGLPSSNAAGYTLTETQPPTYYDGKETPGTIGGATGGTTTNDGTASPPNSITGVNHNANSPSTQYNFAEIVPAPAITLAKTVYQGHNSGAGCGTATNSVTAPPGTQVTYCFKVTNTGNTHLKTITVSDTTLGSPAVTLLSGTLPLAPGASATYYYQTTMPVSLVNSADVTGTPSQADGTTITGQSPVTANDTAQVTTESPTVSIGNFVWNDANGNGIQDDGASSGLAGAVVTLFAADGITQITSDAFGAPISPITTGPSGIYTFTNLSPGTYVVKVVPPSGYVKTEEDAVAGTQATDSDGLDETVVATTAGTFYEDNDFGFVQTGTISGQVYEDLNNNGIDDGVGEPGIAGVTINLSCVDLNGVAYTASTTTNATGQYSFSNVPPGTCTVTEPTQPPAYGDGKDSSPSGTPAAVPGDSITGVTVAPGGSVNNVQFGEQRGSIAGIVYEDVNANGVYDAGTDLPINGATVTLSGTDVNGNSVTQSVTTGASGTYTFTNLLASNASGYTVTETQPPGYSDGAETVGSTGGTAAVNDKISGITLDGGENATNYNFGEVKTASVSGRVYSDNNVLGPNGTFDAGDTGVPGVTITLTGTDAFGNPVSLTTTTNPDGTYTFTGVPPSAPGGYTITETQPAGLGSGPEEADNVRPGVVVTSGGSVANQNFGETPGSLAGTVYVDLNGNGVQDSGEPGIPGVTVTLTGVDAGGNAVGPVTATTNATGDYIFTGLRGGTYVLNETQPAQYGDGTDAVGSTGGNAANPGDSISVITLGAAENATDYDFGEVTGSISGLVYVDANNNGAQDPGEPGIPGVLITLTGTDAAGNPVTKTATTGPNGAYTLTGLPASNGAGYTLTETQPAAYGDGAETPGSTGGTASPPNSIAQVTLGPGENATDYLFGELPAQLSGKVYVDVDNSGTLTGPDTGIAGVTVTLTGKDLDGNTVTRTTVTDGSGNYVFANLPASNAAGYTITETQPAAYGDGADNPGSGGGVATAPDSIVGAVVPAGGNVVNNNFGEITGSIAGTVYEDLNNNGVQDPGEKGIAGVTVELTGVDAAGNPVGPITATTNATGGYVFNGLPAGNYKVIESQPSQYADGTDHVGSTGGTLLGPDSITTISLAAGEAATSYDFGELLGSIAGTVYEDTNGNGVQDPGEPGIPNVTMTLTGTNDLGAIVPITVTTGPTGAYVFPNLRPGTYVVTEPTQPTGFLDGKESAPAGAGTVVNPGDAITAIPLSAGQNQVKLNFGEVKPATLSGSVFNDVNNNGIDDGAGEPPIQGVTVTLTGTDFQGNPVSLTATTDANGNYTIANIPPSGPLGYTVTETQPAQYGDGIDSAGTEGGNLSPSDSVTGVTIEPGDAATGYNFGELLGSIAGSVYFDGDTDGVRDLGETGIAGVTVKLTGTDSSGNPVSLTATTDGDGRYVFPNLKPGTYTVTETQPAGYVDGLEHVGTSGGSAATNDVVSAINLGAGVNATAYDFGEYKPNSLSGTVFLDPNNNGVQDPGETGVANVPITLSGTDANGNPIPPRTVLTDANGHYVFADLPPGTYNVVEPTQPAGIGDGKETAGNGGGDTSVNDKIATISMTPGTTLTGYNFAEVPSSIAGTVWEDLDGDGNRDSGEPGIPGVTVTLTGTDANGAIVPLTATTDANGNYIFDNLKAGTYAVTETQPAGYTDWKDNPGSVGGTRTPTDALTAVTLPAGTDAVGYDFGEIKPASLTGVVYNDVGADGPTVGDPGIAGVTVTLTGTDTLGNPVTLTAVTNGSGVYTFPSVPPGTYTIKETQPATHLDGIDTPGDKGGTVTANDTITPITLKPGDAASGYLFGEVLPASVSGSVYEDLNNNGVDDGAGEAPIPGTLVTLSGFDFQGNPVLFSALTDPSGNYTFPNVAPSGPAGYTIIETQPAGYGDGKDAIGTEGGTLSPPDTVTGVTVEPGDTATGYNFGEVLGAISGAVYEDVNGNGVQDPGEPGIAGVTVKLSGTDSNGNAVALTTTTDGQGNYVFLNLHPSNASGYTVTETQPALYLDGKESSPTGTLSNPGDSIKAIVLGPGQSLPANNFGEVKPATVSGSVFEDTNGNGIDDGLTDPPIAGVALTLTGKDFQGNPVSIPATTDANGNYIFTDVPPSDPDGYKIVETQPSPYGDGPDTPGTEGGSAVAPDTISGITIEPGDTATGYNFAEVLGSIAGSVFIDGDNDGVRDPGEVGIPGATVTLTGPGGPLTATTDGEGNYVFTGLASGTYTVTETQPSGYVDGLEHVGSTGGSTATNDVISTISLDAGEAATAYDFGETKPNSISGTVFRDDNNNGVQDPGEPGLPGVPITLTGTNAQGQALPPVTINTDPFGNYIFTNLPPGTYVLTEPTQPTGLGDGKETAGTAGGDVSVNDKITAVTLQSGQTLTGYTFAEVPSSIAGTVYEDLNGNGSQDAGEPGIAGVTVTLTGTNANGAIVPVTATTDPFGNYVFDGLLSGTYKVSETQPAGYTDWNDTVGSVGGTAVNPGDEVNAIVLPAGTAGTDYDFGEIKPTSLSGAVFKDVDGDGVQDVGPDTGIAGVVMTLKGFDTLGNPVTLTATTGGDGSYTFPNVPPGTYTLIEPQPAGYLDGIDTPGTNGGILSNDKVSAIVIKPGDTAQAYNFAEVVPATVSGKVYEDRNNDGIAAVAGEPGVAATTVTLTGTDFQGNPVSMTVTTDSNGVYTFVDVPPSGPAGYTITETQPSAYGDGKDTLGNEGGVVGADTFTGVSIEPGDTATGYNFGELLGSIAGTVYEDVNGNGVQDPGEPGIPNVDVKLSGKDLNGNLVNVTVQTNGSGDYVFPNLLPSDTAGYTVSEPTQPSGFLDGKESAPGVGGTPQNPGDSITKLPLSAGQNQVDHDFGEVKPATVTTLVFDDKDKDGIADPGEPGIPGVTVTLVGTDFQGNPVSIPGITGPDGKVIFTNVPPGTYDLVENQPTQYGDGLDAPGNEGGTPVNPGDRINGLTIEPGDAATGYTFGEVRGSIAGSVYEDLDNDGVRDPGEAGIPGVTVTLTGTDVNGAIVPVTATTDADGNYVFTNLLAGTYKVAETQPPSHLDGKDRVGSTGGTLANDVVSAITLDAGENAVNYDFGEVRSTTVSGNVYEDRNNNGSKQPTGEPGIGGVTITLTGTDAQGNPVSLTTTTLPNGDFFFLNVPPSSPAGYTLTESQPAGLADGADTPGVNGGDVTVNDKISGIVIKSGDVASGNLFGEVPGSLAGNVWNDVNGNGQRDAGEPGIPGATVTLTGTDVNGNVGPVTATTDALGNYVFDGLRAGTYKVVETQPAGFDDGKDNIGSVGGTVGPDQFSGVVLPAGVDATDYDFGEIKLASLQSIVYDDLNGNGVRDPGEPGIGGVVVELRGVDLNGNPLPTLSLTTNGSGIVDFTGLQPGTYQLVEQQPAGYLDGKETVGNEGGTKESPDTINTITIEPGDAATGYLFGEVKPASVSGTVYVDRNNDANKTVTEPGIADVELILSGVDFQGNPVEAYATTDASGNYTFANLPPAGPSGYRVTETQPLTYVDGKEKVGSLGGVLQPADSIRSIPVKPGENGTGYLFGEHGASISGTVWFDADNDGVNDSTETGIMGVTVMLIGTDVNGNPVSLTTTTDANGNYVFADLLPGRYSVVETQPAGYLDGIDNVGSVGGVAVAPDTLATIDLGAGVNAVDYDFGEVKPATLAGTVFEDRDGDGVKDPGEPGIEGVTVKLVGTDFQGNPVSLTVLTDATGAYLLTNVPPGTYDVIETQPQNYGDGKDTPGTEGGVSVEPDKITGVTIEQGDTATGYDFAEVKGSIAGSVFHDLDNDGVRDPGEAGIEGVTVKLTGVDLDGNPVSIEVTTDANGNYLFDRLSPGDYIVTETQPTAYLDGKDAAGTAGGTVSNDKVAAISLDPGEKATGYTFGELKPASIQGWVYLDKDNDGVRDTCPLPTGTALRTLAGGCKADPPIPGTTVTLTGVVDGVPITPITITTGPDGSYEFKNLLPGSYTVTETQPAKYYDGGTTAGSSGGDASKSNVISKIDLSSDEHSKGNNFGEVPPAEISGKVYHDVGGDGVFTPGVDKPIAGAVIWLIGRDADGHLVRRKTVTDAKGNWKFTDVPTGTYAVKEIQPNGFIDWVDLPGSEGGSSNGKDKIEHISLQPGDVAVNYDFSEIKADEEMPGTF